MNREDAKGFEDAMLLIECVLDTLIEMGNCVTDVKSYEVASDLFKVREILKKEQETGKLLRICSMTGEECSNRDDPEKCKLVPEALQKQIPRKPTPNEAPEFRHVSTYICPRCGKNFSGYKVAKYCYHCGQKLDWEEEKG